MSLRWNEGTESAETGGRTAVDLVVIGFGDVGATVALAATRGGARVTAVGPEVPGGTLQSAARTAGVQVRSGVVHEITVVNSSVTGVGFGDDDHVDGALGWIPCSVIVLAVSAPHWDFVGTAVWSVQRTRRSWGMRAGVSRRPGASRQPAGPPGMPVDPELAVRRWCALAECGPVAANAQRPLSVADASGLLWADPHQPLPGMYTAVPPRPRHPRLSPAARRAAARQVGEEAARAVPVELRSIG